MKALAKTKAIRRKIASVGPLATAKLVANHVFDRVAHRTLLLYHADLPGYAIPAEASSELVRVREVDAFETIASEDVAAIRDYAGDEYVKEARNRLSDGWTLFLASADGVPAGGGWVITSAAPFRCKAVPILAGDLSINDCFTFPSQRGKNVYPAMLGHIAEHYSSKGFVRAFISVHQRNPASIRGIEKAGFQSSIAYEEFHLGSSEIIVWKDYRKREPDST